ncbi:MAG: transcriptional regulator [Bacteroidetes bacterium]|nr:transcriptional regulator [Bacteroidota bacterium]
MTIWRTVQATIQATIQATVQAESQNTAQLFDNVQDMAHRLVLVLYKKMTRNELMEVLDLRNRANFATQYLEPALQQKLIKMTLPDKPTSPNQQYQLTPKGRKLKRELTQNLEE